MDDEEADVNFELLRSTSTDLNTMSDDFLSMLNTDCKAADIDEFNSWFQDNITPDTNIITSDNILDTFGTEGDLDQISHSTETYLQGDPSLTTHYYSSYNEMQAVPNPQDINGHTDGNYIAPFKIETTTTSPYNEDSSLRYATLNNTHKPERDTHSYNQGSTANSNIPVVVERSDDFYIKETYYQDESGNTFIEQEYIRKKDIPYSNGQRQPVNQPHVGTKRPRAVQQIAEPQYRAVTSNNKEYTPQKTVIRPVRSLIHKVQAKPNPNMARQLKVSQMPMQRHAPVKHEIRVGPTMRANTEHNTVDRSPVNVDQKTRIYIPNTDRGYQTITSQPNTSPSRAVYLSPRGKVTSPVRYQSPSRESSVSPELQQNTPPKDERLSPTTGVINAWEQSIKQSSSGSITFNNGRVQIHRAKVQGKSPPVAVQQTTKVIKSPQSAPRLVGNKVEVAKMPVIKQVKNESTPKSSCKVSNSNKKEVNHISITGKPGLVNLKTDDVPFNLKIVKPVNSTKPIVKQTKVSVKAEKKEPEEPEEEEEEEPEEKRTNHNAVERKYRYSINDKIMELRQMLVPKDTKIQKSGVLRRAIEHISNLQSTIRKLKFDNIQLKKKQDILEQNNHVLTLKLADQGATVVYLEKTPDLIEPAGPYSDMNDFVTKQTEDTADSPTKSPDCYGNQHMYQHLPDSPESLRQSDGEMRHARSNSGSSGGYSSSDDAASRLTKKPRYTNNVSHRDQRTIPMLCMVFMFGLFIPSFLPQQSIASTSFGRSLLSVSKSHDYIATVLHFAMLWLGLIITSTLLYLFFVIKSKVVIKDETIFKKHLDSIKQSIKNGDESVAQTDLEHVLCNVGVRVYHTKLSYHLMLLEYALSILPHNRVVHWLCCNNSNVLSDMLLQLAHLHASRKAKHYEDWTSLCYALQASRYNITSTNVYITLSLFVKSALVKAHFYRRSNRRDDRWISRAKDFILSKKVEDIPQGESVSSTLELQYAQALVTRAAETLVLSDGGTVERKRAADNLINCALPSLSFLRREFPIEVKELYWLINVLETYQAPEEDVKSLKFNDASKVTTVVSTVFGMTEESASDVTELDVSDVIERLYNIADTCPSNLHKGILCAAVDWLFGVQIDAWRQCENVSLNQKTNFKRTIQLLEVFGGPRAQYKVSLYTTIHRVMCQANPTLTRKHLHSILNPAHHTVHNFEQVLAIEVCMKYVPSLLLPAKDKLLDHMNIFLHSLD